MQTGPIVANLLLSPIHIGCDLVLTAVACSVVHSDALVDGQGIATAVVGIEYRHASFLVVPVVVTRGAGRGVIKAQDLLHGHFTNVVVVSGVWAAYRPLVARGLISAATAIIATMVAVVGPAISITIHVIMLVAIGYLLAQTALADLINAALAFR